MEVTKFVMEALTDLEIIAIISLAVKGAFDAAFWPGILKQLRIVGAHRIYITSQKTIFTIELPLCQLIIYA